MVIYMQYLKIKQNVEALSCGKVELVCVSKYHTIEEIEEVYGMGQRHFGENKVQDLLQKADVLPKDIKWHLLGHLQTNKVKQIVGKVELIHSLDSIHLAEEIQKQSEKAGVVTNCLVQVNSTGIDDRFGVSYDELNSFIEQVSNLPNICLAGIMGMAPKGENPDPYFEKLKEAYENSPLKGKVLSMGMSEDYESAIKNGSTMVRLGRIIFE